MYIHLYFFYFGVYYHRYSYILYIYCKFIYVCTFLLLFWGGLYLEGFGKNKKFGLEKGAFIPGEGLYLDQHSNQFF